MNQQAFPPGRPLARKSSSQTENQRREAAPDVPDRKLPARNPPPGVMHPRRVQHLEIDLIGIEEAKERPEAEENRPLQPIDAPRARPRHLRAVIYLSRIFHP